MINLMMATSINKDSFRAAASKAGMSVFCQEDFDEFRETVIRLEQRGVITLPKAQKGGHHG